MTWRFFRNTLFSGGLFAGLIAAGLQLTQPAESEEHAKAPSEAGEESAEEPVS